jgi:hypothetical protein
MSKNPFVDSVYRYIRGCNTGDRELLVSTFTEDIRAYFLHRPPVQGRKNLAKFWLGFHHATNARWTVDHTIVQGNEVAVEWSMLWTPAAASREEFARGTDWFVFENGRIAEIRQY